MESGSVFYMEKIEILNWLLQWQSQGSMNYECVLTALKKIEDVQQFFLGAKSKETAIRK